MAFDMVDLARPDNFAAAFNVCFMPVSYCSIAELVTGFDPVLSNNMPYSFLRKQGGW
jgi:hypothetical protein